MHPKHVGEAVEVAVAIENYQRVWIQNYHKLAEFTHFWPISSLKSRVTKVAKTNASATATFIASFWKITFFGQISWSLTQITRINVNFSLISTLNNQMCVKMGEKRF